MTDTKTLFGRRIEPPFAADGALIGEWPAAGDYWPQSDAWYGVTPNEPPAEPEGETTR